jgi:Flp pilus assembly protein TadB
MLDLATAVAAGVAGASCTVAVLAVALRAPGGDAAGRLDRRTAQRARAAGSRAWSRGFQVRRGREWLQNLIDRAGWNESPERVTVFGIAFSSSLAVLGVAVSSLMHVGDGAALGVVGFAAGIGSCALALRSAIAGRRRRLTAELVPLLELFTLELSGGGNATSALGTVTAKVQGELAADIRRLLIAAQVAGTMPFEARLMQQADQLGIPPLASLATILAASREYGTGVVHGVRALATDLRHVQRRELITQSRRALNHVLIPAAVGVLLPFLAIVMFPAVTVLQRNLR